MIVVPVSDVDRSLDYYANTVGFALAVDHRDGDFRVVQLTPPGSACSISFGTTINPSPPGSLSRDRNTGVSPTTRVRPDRVCNSSRERINTRPRGFCATLSRT